MQTFLIIVVIILLIPLLYLLTGFMPGRTLKPKNGRLYFIGLFNKILWVVIGSKSSAFIPLPLFFRRIQIELTWTEYEKVNETYQGGLQQYYNVEKRIGTKTEMTDLRQLEEHPIVVDTVMSDGYHISLVFDVTLDIFDAMALVPRKGFLTYVQQEFSDVVSPWIHGATTTNDAGQIVPKNDIDNILSLKVEEVKKYITFTIDDEECNLIDFLNTKKFEPYGFRIIELALKIGLPKESQKYFEIKNRQKNEEARKLELEAYEQSRSQERETFKNDATAEREVQEKDLEITKDYQKGIIKEVYKGQRKVAAAYDVDVLVLNGNNSSDNTANVKKVEDMTNGIVGTLIAHKRLQKREVKNESTTKEE